MLNTPLSPKEKAGVYVIPIFNNNFNHNEVYVGSTIHTLETEHKYDIKMAKLNTALAWAAYENIDIDWQNAKII